MFCLSLISEAKMRQSVTQVLVTFWTFMDTKKTMKALWESVMWYG